MDNLRDILKSSEIIRTAFDTSKGLGQKVYLVGGVVRDILINSSLGSDFDFVVEGEGVPFARRFAEKALGSFFIMDDERDTSRVVSKNKFQADFSGIRGIIKEDLMLRDFTINSMAIPLDLVFEEGTVEVLDPLNGRKDIEEKILRVSSLDSIHQDPLRIMRAFRLSSSLGFSIDEELLKMIKRDSEELNTVSAERVRSELFMILEMPRAPKTLEDMDKTGVLKTIFPDVEKWKGFFQGGWHAHDLFDHSMKAVYAAEEVLGHLNRNFPGYGKEIEDYMTEEIEAFLTRKGLVKLASLFHDSGKLYTRTIVYGRGRFLGHEKKGEEISAEVAKRLKLSRRAQTAVTGLTASHMRILGLSKLKKITTRAKYRFFRDAEGYAIDLLILSLADAMATPVEGKRLDEFKGLINGLVRYYFEEFIAAPQAPLLTGEDIMKLFGIPEGKEIGRLMEALREAEALGKVSDKKQAVGYLRKLVP